MSTPPGYARPIAERRRLAAIARVVGVTAGNAVVLGVMIALAGAHASVLLRAFGVRLF